MKGKIKWYSEAKGYGFIIAEDGVEAFFHKSGLSTGTQPYEGCAVSFELGEGRKGPKAINIHAEIAA